jgi:HSP20 family protein
MRFYVNDNNSIINGAWTNWSNLQSKYPPLDIIETSDSYKVEVELPGFKLDDLKIKLDKHVLRIASSYENCKQEGRRYIIKERVCKEFERTLSIGSDVDEDKIKASLKNGILIINMPKKEEIVPKQINIAVNG